MKKITILFALVFAAFFSYGQNNNNRTRPVVLDSVYTLTQFNNFNQNPLFRNAFTRVLTNMGDTVVFFVDVAGRVAFLGGIGGNPTEVITDGVIQGNGTISFPVEMAPGDTTGQTIVWNNSSQEWEIRTLLDRNGYYGGNGGNGGDATVPSVTRSTLTDQLTMYRATDNFNDGKVPLRVEVNGGTYPDFQTWKHNPSGDSLHVQYLDNEFQLRATGGFYVGSGKSLNMYALDSIRFQSGIQNALAGHNTYMLLSPNNYLYKRTGVPLNNLQQNGATPGNVILWNGTAWVPGIGGAALPTGLHTETVWFNAANQLIRNGILKNDSTNVAIGAPLKAINRLNIVGRTQSQGVTQLGRAYNFNIPHSPGYTPFAVIDTGAQRSRSWFRNAMGGTGRGTQVWVYGTGSGASAQQSLHVGFPYGELGNYSWAFAGMNNTGRLLIALTDSTGLSSSVSQGISMAIDPDTRNVGFVRGDAAATAKVHIGAQTSAAFSAPIKVTPTDELMSAEEYGAFEFLERGAGVSGYVQYENTPIFTGGTSGTPVRYAIQKGFNERVQLTFGNSAPGTVDRLVVAVGSAQPGDNIQVSPPGVGYPDDGDLDGGGFFYTAHCKNAGFITIQQHNLTTQPLAGFTDFFTITVTRQR